MDKKYYYIGGYTSEIINFERKSMNKQETYEFLKQKGISYEVTEHEAVFHMGESGGVELPYPDCDAKNLFIRDDKKTHYYLITVKGDKRVDLKEFRKSQGTRPLTFASAEDLLAIMKLTPGSVTPFGLLSDEERKVEFYFDESFFEEPGLIGCHPNENTATVWVSAEDVAALIREHGNPVTIMKF